VQQGEVKGADEMTALAKLEVRLWHTGHNHGWQGIYDAATFDVQPIRHTAETFIAEGIDKGMVIPATGPMLECTAPPAMEFRLHGQYWRSTPAWSESVRAVKPSRVKPALVD
jgi:hypothetical protein